MLLCSPALLKVVLLLVSVLARMDISKVWRFGSCVSGTSAVRRTRRKARPFFFVFLWVLLCIRLETEAPSNTVQLLLFDPAANSLRLLLPSTPGISLFCSGALMLCFQAWQLLSTRLVRTACRKSLPDSRVSKCMTKPSLHVLLVSDIKLLYALVTH